MARITKTFVVDYATVGCFDTNPAWAEKVSVKEGDEWRGDARMRFSALKTDDGKLFITNEIWTMLGMSSGTIDAKIGRAYLYDFGKHFDELMKRQSYPERNDRERFVTRRNLKMIEVLFNLL